MWALMNFQKATCEPLGRKRSPPQYIRFLIFNIQANRVAIVSSVITKIFNPSKYWTVTIQLLFERHSFDQWLYCLLLVFIVRFSALFDLVLLFQCSNYSVYVLSWSWKCIPGISIPLYTNHQAINKHHTADSVIFCLGIGNERPITIIDIEGYLEPISPYWLRDSETVIVIFQFCIFWLLLFFTTGTVSLCCCRLSTALCYCKSTTKH